MDYRVAKQKVLQQMKLVVPHTDLSVLQWLMRWEGVVSHMYLDTRGNVTIGVGHNLGRPKDAESAAGRLRFVLRGGTQGAQRQQIPSVLRSDLQTLAGARFGAQFGAASFAPLTHLDLDDTEICRLLLADAREYLHALRRSFPGLDRAPEPARLALFDMIFNLGETKFLLYKQLLDAARRTPPDWARCAEECFRHGLPLERNEATRDLFMLAAETTRHGGPRILGMGLQNSPYWRC